MEFYGNFMVIEWDLWWILLSIHISNSLPTWWMNEENTEQMVWNIGEIYGVMMVNDRQYMVNIWVLYGIIMG
jgi:hypothetical protein